MRKTFISRIPLLFAFLLMACTSPDDRCLEQALVFAGNNRGELEKVLTHYEGDSLKQEAARFLISNMPYHFSSESWLAGPDGKHYRPDLSLFAGSETVREHCDSLLCAGYRVERQNRYDIRHIRADYLINRIDRAFEVWDKPWAREVSFADFCRYILPYRSQNEPLTTLADTFRIRYLPLLDSAGVRTAYEACCLINERLKDKIRYAETGCPFAISVDEMDRTGKGTCDALCDYTVHVMRSVGIPVSVHQTVWTRMARGHVWPAVLSGGRFHDFDPAGQSPDTYAGTLHEVAYLKPAKVYRKGYEAATASMSGPDDGYVTFLKSPLIKDVTDEQPVPAYTLRIPLDDDASVGKGDPLYLCAFNSLQWVPVALGQVDSDGKAMFGKVLGRNFFLVARAESRNRLRMVSLPLCTYGDGRFRMLPADLSSTVWHTFARNKSEGNYLLDYWDSVHKRFMPLTPDEVTDSTLTYGHIPGDALLFYRPEAGSVHDRVGVIDSAGVYKVSSAW